MFSLRKLDLYGQVMIFFTAVLLVIIADFRDMLIVLFALCIWQMASALLNTKSYLNAGRKKSIVIYWLIILPVTLISLLTARFQFINQGSTGVVLGYSLIVVCLSITLYYWINYNSLVAHLEYKKEISGLLKS